MRETRAAYVPVPAETGTLNACRNINTCSKCKPNIYGMDRRAKEDTARSSLPSAAFRKRGENELTEGSVYADVIRVFVVPPL